MIAQLWMLEPHERDTPELMAAAMRRSERLQALVARLAPHERDALVRLQAQGGQVAAPLLEREYGRVRTHSDYPNPRAYLLALGQRPSAVERLYVLGLVQAAHDGLRRYFVLTPDLAPLLPAVDVRPLAFALPPALPPGQEQPADVRAFERALTRLLRMAQEGQLEAQRGGLKKSSLALLPRLWDADQADTAVREEQWPYAQFVRQIASDAGFVREDAGGGLRPTRAALEWMRQGALTRARQLLDTWARSSWDELTAIVGHRVQNTYRRDVQLGKHEILALLGQLPAGSWVALAEVCREVQRVAPDFARPDGDYLAWRVTSRLREPLDGFEHWQRVEGALIRAVLCRSLHWLGLIDLGRQGDSALVRLSALGQALVCGGAGGEQDETPALVVQSNFEVLVAAGAAPAARFQLGRVAEVVRDGPAGLFRLTRRSLQGALERGIALGEVVSFLEREAGATLPQNVGATLREWADEYGRITIRSSALLEADSPATLEQIRRDKRVRLPASVQIGEQTWSIALADAAGFTERLRRAGYAVASDVARPTGMALSERDLTVIYAALMFYAQAGPRLGYEHDASGALLQRVARLLPEQQRNRAFRLRDDALRGLSGACGADPAADS
jgi:hypothetical protein